LPIPDEVKIFNFIMASSGLGAKAVPENLRFLNLLIPCVFGIVFNLSGL